VAEWKSVKKINGKPKDLVFVPNRRGENLKLHTEFLIAARKHEPLDTELKFSIILFSKSATCWYLTSIPGTEILYRGMKFCTRDRNWYI
jgi:hypothetical protein